MARWLRPDRGRNRGNHGEPHRQAQDQGQEEAPAKFFDLRFRGAGGPLLPGRPFHFVTCVRNHPGEGPGVGEARIIPYLGLAGGQVDCGQLHPGGGRQGPFHPGDAGGAGHAPHGEADFFSRGHGPSPLRVQKSCQAPAFLAPRAYTWYYTPMGKMLKPRWGRKTRVRFLGRGGPGSRRRPDMAGRGAPGL